MVQAVDSCLQKEAMQNSFFPRLPLTVATRGSSNHWVFVIFGRFSYIIDHKWLGPNMTVRTWCHEWNRASLRRTRNMCAVSLEALLVIEYL